MKTIFDSVILSASAVKSDKRGICRRFDSDTINTVRVYEMPHTGTFFGIHYHEDVQKTISVIRGSGADFVIDLRPGSPTYLKWEMNILSAENGSVIYIPQGFGHAFISLEDDTVQLFGCDCERPSKRSNYRDSKIGLELPVSVVDISDEDDSAPFLV